MRQYEYRLAEVVLEGKAKRDDQVTAALNKFGADGWRVAGLEVSPDPAVSAKSVRVWLERRVDNRTEIPAKTKVRKKTSTKAAKS